jgi:hypothetical protein
MNEGSGKAIFILGSIHAYMLKNPGYTIRDFAGSMSLFKPDLILTSTRVDRSNPLDGSIDGGVDQAIVHALAKSIGVTAIAIDWVEEEYFSALNDAESQFAADELRKLKAMIYEYQRAVREEPFSALQNARTQSSIQRIYEMNDQSGVVTRRLARLWQNTEEAISSNTAHRILLVIPLDFKYFFEKAFAARGQPVIRFEEFTTLPHLKSFQISRALLDESTKTISEARALLKSRLLTSFYTAGEKSRLATKIKEFDVWLSHLQEF